MCNNLVIDFVIVIDIVDADRVKAGLHDSYTEALIKCLVHWLVKPHSDETFRIGSRLCRQTLSEYVAFNTYGTAATMC